MASLSLEDLIPRKILQPLRTIGKFDWLHWEQRETNPPTTRIELRIPDLPEVTQHVEFIRLLRNICQREPSMLWTLYAQSKLLADGPKILRPTIEQCEALEHVDVNLSFAEYEQPFSAFLVEIPTAYRCQLSERFACGCPRFVLNCHDRRTRYIVSISVTGFDCGGAFTTLSPRPQWQNIEDALHACFVEDGPDLQLAEVLYRIAINFGLLLTRFGAKDCGPIDPMAHARHEQIARRKSGRKAERARRLISNTINLIDFDQKVIFCDRPPTGGKSLGDSKCKKPHWRRGHFRKQPCGAGRAAKGLIFVRPCFINADSFHGDLADTRYSIRVPNMDSHEVISTP